MSPVRSPTMEAWLRASERRGCPWGGGRGWGQGGRAEVRTSSAWCVAIKPQAITTTLLPARDAKVFLTVLSVPLESVF